MGCDVTKLSAKYESAGNPGAIGYDLAGGWSYGAAQIATRVGSMVSFLAFLQQSYPAFHAALIAAGGNAAATIGSQVFKAAWVKLATTATAAFLCCQQDFIIEKTYTVALRELATVQIDLSARGCTLQNSIYSFSVMAGPGQPIANGRGACGLIFDAIQILGGAQQLCQFSDLSILNQMYANKLKRIDSRVEYASANPAIRESVRNRVIHEHQDALAMIATETKT
jgi:type VI secretion system (T6SS) spike protein VgrG3